MLEIQDAIDNFARSFENLTEALAEHRPLLAGTEPMGRPRKHNKHLPSRVVERHGAYYYIAPDTHWHRLARIPDLAAMYKALAEALSRSHGPTMNDLFDRYTQLIMPHKAATTRAGQTIQLEALRTAFGKRSPNSIEPHEIAEYLDTRTSKIGANREIALLSAVFTAGVRWNKAKRNPCLGVERNIETPRKVYVSSPRFWAAWSAAPLSLGLTMELSLTTGQRLGDLLNLKWTAIHEDGIHFIQRKTGVAIVIAWTEWLQDLIARCREIPNTTPFVLVNTRGQRWTADGFKTAWQRFMHAREDRFQFRDIRKKSANDGDTGDHLGNDKKTLDKWYMLKPRRASALSGRETPVILDNVLD